MVDCKVVNVSEEFVIFCGGSVDYRGVVGIR